MLVNIIQNTISSFRSALAAASVITTNLKMWLGFETSETLGREEVTDGDFPTGTTAWNRNSNWTIGVDVAIADGTTNGDINQGTTLATPGNLYTITYEVVSISQGSFFFRFGGVSGISRDEPRIYTEVIKAINTDRLYIDSLNNAIGSVTNISIKELTQITPDKSGNNNVGELFTGKALEFDGSTEYVDVDGFQMAGTNATFAFWFNSNDTLGRFFDTVKDLSDNRLIISFNNNQISILDDTLSWFNFGSVTTNVWNRCVITIKGTTAKCFVNGIQLGTEKTISTIDLSLNTNAAIGSHFAGTQSYFDGEISDFQIYNADWSTDDIAFDYANPNILVTDSTNTGTSIAVTNLKAYWAMSEGAGFLAYDSSGEGNNGTINGATYEPVQPRIPQLGMQNWSKGSNLLTYSEDFSQWTQEGSILTTDNSIISPDGNQNASKLQLTGSSSNTDGKISFNITSNATTHTFSVFGKKGNHDYIYIWMNISGGTNITRWIDLDDGSINVGTGIATVTTTSFSNDWWKIEYIFDATNLSKIVLEVADDGVSTGTGGDNIYIWGGQLEESSSAGAYRLTDGAATLNSTVIPNPTIPTQDIFGNAVRDRLNSFNLDGSGYAEVADDTDLDFGTGDFTLECWAKYDFVTQGSGWNVLVSNGSISSSGGSGFSLASSISNFSIRLNAGTAVTISFGTDNMTVGNWYHLVVTREGTTLKTYRDTSLKNSSTIISVDVDTSLPVKIGKDSKSDRFYQNLISDVRLYKGKALSATEIENNYNAGLSAHTN